MNVQRRIADSTKGLSQTFERLSSGLRINRAADDAAGLSIAASLNVDARVFNQGVRNLNDAVGLLNIVDSALGELGGILTRIDELATQSANGTFSREQRLALHDEAQELAHEYNRIIESTSYNGLNPLLNSFGDLLVQAGYGTKGSLTFDSNEELSRHTGDGSFAAPIVVASGNRVTDVTSADFNGDGFADVATADNMTDNTVSVHFGNGDGTFQGRVILPGGSDVASITSGDLNNDGIADIVTTDANGDNTVSVFLSNGDGTFQARTAYSSGAVAIDATLGDFNNDGNLDIAAAGAVVTNNLTILMGDGSGGFTPATVPTIASGTNTQAVDATDFNGDGFDDLVTANTTANTVTVHIGNGDGTFAAGVAYATGNQTVDVATGDFNGDGLEDIIAANNVDNTVSVLFGDGTGGFAPQTTLSAGNSTLGVLAADINGDNVDDIVALATTPDSSVTVFLSNADDTFETGIVSSGGVTARAVAGGDFNEDGAVDLAVGNFIGNSFSVLESSTTGRNTLLLVNEFDIDTVENARNAMSAVDSARERLLGERGAVGAFTSRLNTATENLRVGAENFKASESRIIDVDVASETAELAKFRILQEAGVAIMAQANQVSELALDLLQGLPIDEE